MKFLRDENELNKFLDFFFDLEEGECYSVMLGARRKYLKDDEKDNYAMAGTDMLRRQIVHRREGVIEAIKCFEQGVYTDRNGKRLPEHAFAMYITNNPRSHKKAAQDLIHTLVDRIFRDDSFRLNSLVETALHRNHARKLFIDFDFDIEMDMSKGYDHPDLYLILNTCAENLGDSKFHVVMTRGGFHLLLDIRQIDPKIKNTFYKNMIGMNDNGYVRYRSGDDKRGNKVPGEVEVKGDGMSPLPGCIQGGYSHPFVMDKNVSHLPS